MRELTLRTTRRLMGRTSPALRSRKIRFSCGKPQRATCIRASHNVSSMRPPNESRHTPRPNTALSFGSTSRPSSVARSSNIAAATACTSVRPCRGFLTLRWQPGRKGRRSRRPLLRGLEQARRSALAHHVPRIAPMGARPSAVFLLRSDGVLITLRGDRFPPRRAARDDTNVKVCPAQALAV